MNVTSSIPKTSFPLDEQRVLFAFAHPDDETILCGGSMARLLAAGSQVSLLTCTLGEEGEIIEPSLQELSADRADQLGGWRIYELRRALAQIAAHKGASSPAQEIAQLWLGGAGRWRDSGMVDAGPRHHRAFIDGKKDLQVQEAVRAIRTWKPQVLVTHDPQGGYGHRDHIHAHTVITEAAALAATATEPDLGSSWQVDKIYWAVIQDSPWRTAVAALHENPRTQSYREKGYDVVDPDFAQPWPDERVTTVMDISEFQSHKLAALAEHATQIKTHEDIGAYSLSNKQLCPLVGEEHYFLAFDKSTHLPDARAEGYDRTGSASG